MSDDFDNPYAAPSSGSEALPDVVSDEPELARRFARFAAAFADGLLLLPAILGIQYATGYTQRVLTQQVTFIEQLAMSLVGMVIFLILNGYLLVTRGQTIGKVMAKTQIVDFETNIRLSFFRVYVLRSLWLLPLVLLAHLVPNLAILLNVAILVDALAIFQSNRRCLHDLIAGSKVVVYQAGRPGPA